MTQAEDVTIDLVGIRLADATTDDPYPLPGLGGVRVLVLMRHRH